MGLIKEFREFSVKGNMLDMAVGIVIGVAFGKIVSSLVADVIMPVLGLFVTGLDYMKTTIDNRGAGMSISYKIR
jgi:large conductance mechanosensitive channel